MVKHRSVVWLFLVGFFISATGAYSGQFKKKVWQPLELSAPQNMEVCFSPDEPCDLKLIKFVQSAEKSIDVAIFDITLDKLVHEILVASRKIPVRIVIDRRQSKGAHSLVS